MDVCRLMCMLREGFVEIELSKYCKLHVSHLGGNNQILLSVVGRLQEPVDEAA
jgi:hypothetical protein